MALARAIEACGPILDNHVATHGASVDERDPPDWALADRALDAIRVGVATLAFSPFACRKAIPDTPFLRELLIPFGASGCVALFEIEPRHVVTVLAVRHQREDDYH